MTYWLIETAFKQKQTLQPTADVLSTGLWRLGGKRFQASFIFREWLQGIIHSNDRVKSSLQEEECPISC